VTDHWIPGPPPPGERRLCTVERRGKREVYAGTIGMAGMLVDDAGKLVAAESCVAYWSQPPPQPYFGEASSNPSPLDQAAQTLDAKLRPLGYLQAIGVVEIPAELPVALGQFRQSLQLYLRRRLRPDERAQLSTWLEGGVRWCGFPVELKVVGQVRPLGARHEAE
jgi:hypothetical protein